MTRLFSARKKVLGIIGGMGPMASAYFGRLLVEMADVDTDPDYTPDTEAIVDGYFAESTFRSAPYFDVQIDGINLLNAKF